MQRDSDVNRDVHASRDSALGQVSTLHLQTCANLIPLFQIDYIPRVFCTTLPQVVGGPDFPRQEQYRRTYEDVHQRCHWTCTPP
ncbi:hypothetical protein N9L19_01035 [bacterium]|nr:hypothetical protein [bacterium]